MDITQKALALLAGVTEADVSNYFAKRYGHISQQNRNRIDAALETGKRVSKTSLVELHLERFPTITPAEAFTRYGLHSLGQRITELNARYRRDNIPRHIDNIAPRGAGVHGVYRMVYLEERTEANAELITRAPELYAAARKAEESAA